MQYTMDIMTSLSEKNNLIGILTPIHQWQTKREHVLFVEKIKLDLLFKEDIEVSFFTVPYTL